jgi:hypothetical protein
MCDELYSDFIDPTEEFNRRAQGASWYDLAISVIDGVRNNVSNGGNWYTNNVTVVTIAMLLYAWNSKSKAIRQLTRESLQSLLERSERDLRILQAENIVNVDLNNNL